MRALSQFLQDFGQDILTKTQEHLFLTFIAMLIACTIAIPLGVVLARCRFKPLVSVVMGLVNLVQPVPSLALIALTAALFVYLRDAFGIHLPTIGMLPGMVALVAYALLPMLRNTYTGIRQVDPTLIEVATGMGMRRRQILFNVELPLALPVIMAGVRTATVWTVGVAALVSLVGAGGLGDLIFIGLSRYRVDAILAGAVPAATLALLLDWILSGLEKWLTPSGMRKTPLR